MKYAFKGFKVEVLGNTAGPLYFKKGYEGTSEETKVLVHNEEAHLEHINLEFHGVEIEITGAENLEFIKSIKECSKIIREELIEWGSLIAAVDQAGEQAAAEANAATATAPAAEPIDTPVPPVKPHISAVIAEVLAKVKANMK